MIDDKIDFRLNFIITYLLILINLLFMSVFALQTLNNFKYLDFEKEFLDIEIVRLYDSNEYYDKVPIKYICTENVKVSIVGGDVSSYFSTYHKDNPQHEERGLCFIKWE